MAKNKRGPIIKKGLDDWMATYADMVTLLFCFFVMLYASASTDETKMQYILQQFQTGGRYVNTVVIADDEEIEPREGDGDSDVPFEPPGVNTGNPPGITMSNYMLEQLFADISEIIEIEDVGEAMQIYSTPGMIRLSLTGDVWFPADSSELLPAGRAVLDLIVPAIKATNEYIKTVQAQGHTADVNGYSVIDDWDLSSLRASSVVKYLDGRKMVDSEKFRVEGFSKYSQISSSDLAKNRRVEIIINRDPNLPPEDIRYMDDILTYDYHQGHMDVDHLGAPMMKPGTPLSSVAEGIIGDLLGKYGDKKVDDVSDLFPNQPTTEAGAGPSAESFLDVSDEDFLPPEENAEPAPSNELDETITAIDAENNN